ncbi:MAG: hypothetical protein QG602_2461, partial [Verrucomicrobiota bacterium]|nr:hypothetical protein [Verrucomicrobiota bacterium]
TVRGRGASQWVPTDRQLAEACGLSIAIFKWVSYSTSWAEIPDRVKYRFLDGCDIDLENRRTFKRLEYMRRSGSFRHLRNSPLFATQFVEMLELWEEAHQ